MIAFGYAQLVYACTLLLCYISYFVYAQPFVWRAFEMDALLVSYVYKFWLQSAIKFLLTEGEKYVLLLFRTFSDQGVYDLVSHLGSLVARLFFQKVEEVGFTTWSKLLGSASDKKEKQDDDSQQVLALQLLHLLIKLMLLIGLIFVCFGPSYSYTLLLLLYGRKWSDATNAPTVLSLYCIYVMFMAVNGITEAFVHATSNAQQLQKYNYLMIVFSIVYLSIAVMGMTCIQQQDAGIYMLIVANICNMLMRIVYSWTYITQYTAKYQQQQQVSLVNLDRLVMGAFAMSLLLGQLSKYFLQQPHLLVHIVIGACCFAVTCALIWKRERAFLVRVKQLFRGQGLQ